MKKTLSLVLCAVCAFSVAGCGSRGNNNTDNESGTLLTREEAEEQGLLSSDQGELLIKTMNKGYGSKGLEAIAAAYSKETGISVKVVPTGDIGATVDQEIAAGPEGNEVDIYFASDVPFPSYYYLPETEKFGNSSLLLDLTDFLDTWTPFGEEKTMRETIIPELISYLSVPDIKDASINRTFALPWIGAGTCGFAYNEDLFNEAGATVPTTTDELFVAMDKFLEYNEEHKNDAGFMPIIPIIYPGGDAMDYWAYITHTWWAQYEGYDKYMKYWTLCESDPYLPEKKFYKEQEGLKEAWKVSERIVKNDKYTGGGSKGLGVDSVATNFGGTDAYGKAEGDGTSRFAMTPTGDWFEMEYLSSTAKQLYSKNFKMMKTPVLSSAIEHRGGANNVENISFNLATTHNVIIPAYSAQKYIALDFLSYYFSQEGAKLFMEKSKSLIPLNDFSFLKDSEKNKMSSFLLSQIEIAESENIKYVGRPEQLSPLRFYGAMPPAPDTNPEELMVSKGQTAEEIFNEFIALLDKDWLKYCENAGVEV